VCPVTVLACGVGPSYWRVGLALARLGENRRHWLEWPSGGKSPCFLAGRGAGVGDGLARPAKPGPTNVIPLIPRGQGLSVVIGKEVPSPRVASSFIDRVGGG